MLEDPANLFVLDLATAASESAGVPPLVQVAACLFLGCCFESLPGAASTPPPSSNGTANGASEDSILNRKAFLGMIDSRIGLNRFTDILKKPVASRGHKDAAASYSALFISPDFLVFYQKQVEAIRAGIFEFYTGGASSAVGDVMQQQIIDMQKEKIAELEQKLAELAGNAPNMTEKSDSSTVSAADVAAAVEAAVTATAAELQNKFSEEVRLLESTIEGTRVELSASINAAAQADLSAKHATQEWQATLAKYAEAESSAQALLHRSQAAETAHLQLSEKLAAAEARIVSQEDEAITLKQSVLQEHQEKKQLKEVLDQRERKIEMLLAELRAAQPADGLAERKISDLENRNAELKQQLWEAEAELKKALEQATFALPSTPADVFTDVSLSSTPVPQQSSRDDATFQNIAELVVSLVRTLGLSEDVADFTASETAILDATADKVERSRAVESLLYSCSEALSNAVGECSDIAEGAGIYDLEGDEGSLMRVRDCCRKLRESLSDAQERVADEAQLEQMQLQIDLLTQQLSDAESTAYNLGEQLRTTEDLLQQTSTDLAKTQHELEDSTAEVSALQLQLQSAVNQDSTELETVSAMLEDERSKCATLQEDLCNQTAQLNASLTSAQEQALHLTQERDDLLVELEGIQKASNQSTEEIRSELRKVLHELLQTQHQVSELSSQFEAEKAEIITAHEQKILALSDESACEKERLTAEKVEAEEKFEQERAALLAQVAAVTDVSAAEASQAEQARHELRAQLARATAELTQVTAERAALDEQLASVRAVLVTGQNETEELRTQLRAVRAAAEKEIELAESQLCARTTINSALIIETHTLQSKLRASNQITALLERQRAAQHKKTAALEEQVSLLTTSAADTDRLNELVEHLQGEERRLKAASLQQQRLADERAAELVELRRSSEEEFSRQDQKYAELLQQVEKITAHTVAQKAQIGALQKDIADKTSAEENLKAELASLQQELEAERTTIAQLRSTYEASSSSSDALQSQEQELRRLTQSVDHLAREGNAKDAQIQALSAQLRRRDGEFAGVLTTFESVKADVQQMREENERLSDKYLAENKIVKEREREIRSLQSALQVEAAQAEMLRSKSSEQSSMSATEVTLLAQNRYFNTLFCSPHNFF